MARYGRIWAITDVVLALGAISVPESGSCAHKATGRVSCRIDHPRQAGSRIVPVRFVAHRPGVESFRRIDGETPNHSGP